MGKKKREKKRSQAATDTAIRIEFNSKGAKKNPLELGEKHFSGKL